MDRNTEIEEENPIIPRILFIWIFLPSRMLREAVRDKIQVRLNRDGEKDTHIIVIGTRAKQNLTRIRKHVHLLENLVSVYCEGGCGAARVAPIL